VRALWLVAPVVKQFACGRDPEQTLLNCPMASARLRTAVAVEKHGVKFSDCGDYAVLGHKFVVHAA
jgi:hypothetical protein